MIIIFAIALITPTVLLRSVMLFLKPLPPGPARLPRVHHAHLGIAMIFIAVLGLLLVGNTDYIILLFGLGLGLVFDQFITSLYLPQQEPDSSVVYRKSFMATIVLLLGLVGLTVGLSLLL